MTKHTAFVFAILFTFLSTKVFAMSVDWAGTYRFEYVEIDKTTLADPGLKKSYFLNHLNLSPKIIAADGVNIIGNFEVMPNQAYPNSQVGTSFGTISSGAPSNGSTPSSATNSSQQSSTFEVNQLYMTMNQEYGSLLVGRAPLHFGLGITHNAGQGAFDHWYDVRDLVAYKVLIGNLSIMPAIGKVVKASNAIGTEGQDVIWDFEYNNQETESTLGVFHQSRTVVKDANDAWKAYGSSPADVSGNYKVTDINVLLGRGWDGFKFKMEVGWQSGGTGIKTAALEDIEMKGYGIALEMNFPRPESRWDWTIRTGMVSGDNPTTANYEGYSFDRNYDVAFMLMNHPLGQYDLFTTRPQRPKNVSATCTNTVCPTYATNEAVDDEAISNVIYFSPKVSYKLNDRWDLTNAVTWAQLQQNPSSTFTDVSKDVGFEWDLGFTYKPHEKIRWVNEFGFLFPGAAFKQGGAGLDNSFTYGFQSKAAISF